MDSPPQAPSAAPESNRREKRRQAILESAARLFADEGYAGCEMERVATAIGVAKGTLYLYFPGKQELFFACVDWGMREMQRSVRAAAESREEPLDRISCGIRAYLSFYAEHPHFVELLIQERAIFRDRKRPTYFEHREANLWYWRDLYSGLIAAGRFRTDLPVERILDTVGSQLYGTMFTNHFNGRKTTIEEQADAMLQILFKGLLSDNERQRHDAARDSTVTPPSRVSKPSPGR